MGRFLCADEGVHCKYDWSEIHPSVAVIETIKRYQRNELNREPSGIPEPLQHYLETDALDTVIQSDPTMAIALTIEDYAVEINENAVHVTTHDSLG